jgi:hypothetical protein
MQADTTPTWWTTDLVDGGTDYRFGSVGRPAMRLEPNDTRGDAHIGMGAIVIRALAAG